MPLSYGQAAVGVNFNPGGNPVVNDIKHRFADLIDIMHSLRAEAASPEAKRLASVAITEAQTAQMWAIKAITWTDPE